jgi:hypothetical protein
MAEYDEGEYFVDSQDDINRREVPESSRGEVHTDIHRIHTGAVEQAESDEGEDGAESRKLVRPRWFVWLKGFLTGDILLKKEVERVYTLLTILGVIFFASIATIFAMLNQDLRCNRLQKEVVLLKERAIRTSEACSHKTSHSAILQRLKERGIEIGDPETQPKILK